MDRQTKSHIKTAHLRAALL